MIFCVLFGGGRLCRSAFDVGISSKLTQLLSVCGTSMLGNHDIKISRHTRNHVTKIGLLGQKLVTLLLIADMLPTCHRHNQQSAKEVHLFVIVDFMPCVTVAKWPCYG